MPSEALEYIEIEGYGAALAIHKHAQDDGRTLIVCTVFVATWRWPTYLSFDGIGRLYAEGILVGADGTVTPAPDDVMWEFR